MECVKNKTFDLDLNSDAFNAFKTDFNAMLKAILSGMEKNESENGEISVTMKIGLEERDIIDRGYSRRTMVPSFSHKVVSKMQFKAEKKGSLSGNFELKFDEKSGKYYLVEISDGQTSFFDDGSVADEIYDMDNVLGSKLTDEATERNIPLLETSVISDTDSKYREEDDFDGISYDDGYNYPENIDIDSIDPDEVSF